MTFLIKNELVQMKKKKKKKKIKRNLKNDMITKISKKTLNHILMQFFVLSQSPFQEHIWSNDHPN